MAGRGRLDGWRGLELAVTVRRPEGLAAGRLLGLYRISMSGLAIYRSSKSKLVKRSRFVGFDLVVAAQPHVKSNPSADRHFPFIAIKPR